MTTDSNVNPKWQSLIATAMPAKPRVSLQLIQARDNRHQLTVTTTLRSGPTKQLEIALAQKTAQTLPPFESHRVQCCLKVWTPLLIKLHRRLRCDYSLTMSMSDGGQPKIPSMDSTQSDALIPDLYAMQAALKPETNGKQLSFSRFYKRWKRAAPRCSGGAAQRGSSQGDRLPA